jgi:hypothetical protein
MRYRSPDILFGLQCSKEVELWGWGMVVRISLHSCLNLANLCGVYPYASLKAYLRPDNWELYDRLPGESILNMTRSYEKRVRCDIFHDFQVSAGFDTLLSAIERQLAKLGSEREEVAIPPILGYLQFPEEDIYLLEKVLVLEPGTRPTAKEIGTQ